MKTIAISDLHGHLPDIPACDLLLIGGDICPMESHDPVHQGDYLFGPFTKWLESVPAKNIVGIGGNHDFILDDPTGPALAKKLPWTYLQDEEVTIDGLRIWGTPWVPNLPTWAFHSGFDCEVEPAKIAKIPSGLDIILSHGPMHGYGDVVGKYFGGPLSVGDKTMADAMPWIKPSVFVCGHIHEDRGHYPHPNIEHGIYNVSHMNERYEPTGDPVDLPI